MKETPTGRKPRTEGSTSPTTLDWKSPWFGTCFKLQCTSVPKRRVSCAVVSDGVALRGVAVKLYCGGRYNVAGVMQCREQRGAGVIKRERCGMRWATAGGGRRDARRVPHPLGATFITTHERTRVTSALLRWGVGRGSGQSTNEK
ncbi:hypothetical protein E2C01_047273 [Portunus trituberculatus]|uniref:Uncharacterized protein n=1 Tax=Portunus trituberculatus TaxID=210409 RepID=A0A5B7GA14_PORTR|nr:hypothetical protein [Portunus trituberculatus]